MTDNINRLLHGCLHPASLVPGCSLQRFVEAVLPLPIPKAVGLIGTRSTEPFQNSLSSRHQKPALIHPRLNNVRSGSGTRYTLDRDSGKFRRALDVGLDPLTPGSMAKDPVRASISHAGLRTLRAFVDFEFRHKEA